MKGGFTMSKLFALFSMFVFALGAFMLLSTPAHSEAVPYPSVPFEVTYVRTITSPEGVVRKSLRTRQVQSDGEWREIIESSDNKVTFASLREGMYSYIPGQNSVTEMTGRLPDEEMQQKFRTRAFLERHPAYSRRDTVAGIEVYVHREVFSDTDVDVIEKSYSPLTGFTPLRSYYKYKDGTIATSEAVKVEFKDVPSNDDIRGLPVRVPDNESKALSKRQH
jgi:hypothetical protein